MGKLRERADESHVLHVKDITRPLEFDLSRPLEVEVGCGKGRFLVARAAANPDCDFLGIERMLERVRLFDGKCRRGHVDNAAVLRLEALYTFHYLLPAHHIRRVYVFFPDPWPKKKHHSHRLFGPLFRNALWKRLETGGKIEFATDHGVLRRGVRRICRGRALPPCRADAAAEGGVDGVRGDVPRAGAADPRRRVGGARRRRRAA